jgi:hypothetical protein
VTQGSPSIPDARDKNRSLGFSPGYECRLIRTTPWSSVVPIHHLCHFTCSSCTASTITCPSVPALLIVTRTRWPAANATFVNS